MIYMYIIVPFPVTVTDPKSRFQAHNIIQRHILGGKK